MTSYCFLIRLKNILRGGSRTAATSKVELFVIIVNGFQILSQTAPPWMWQQFLIRI